MVDEERLTAEIALVEEHKADILLHFEVTDDETAAGAAMVVKELSVKKREVEAERKEAVAPLIAKKKEVDSWYKQWTKPIDEINNYLRKQLTTYEREKAAERLEALMLVAEADTPEEAKALMVQATTTSSKVQGVSYQSFVDFEIIDETEVPPAFRSVDVNKIKQALQSEGLSAKIPGVRIFMNKRIRA